METFLKILFTPVRLFFRTLVWFYDRFGSPGVAVTRAPERQAAVDAETKTWILYHFQSCPFCVRVRHQVTKLGLKIEMRDVLRNKEFEKELKDGTGLYQVPCLQIPSLDGPGQWMFESGDINEFLSQQFSK